MILQRRKKKQTKEKQQKISKHVPRVLALPLLNSHTELQNFLSVFVHYSHNSQKLVISF